MYLACQVSFRPDSLANVFELGRAKLFVQIYYLINAVILCHDVLSQYWRLK